MKTFTRLFTISLLFTGIFLGCSKGGDNGPAGPQGQTGSTGAPGNANVKPIKDSVSSASGWTFATSQWYAFFPNPYLNTTFINSGGFIEVFLSTDHGSTWTALPSTYVGSTVTAQWTYSYTTLSSGTGIYIYFQWSDLQQHTDPYTTYGTKAYFNVVSVAASIVNKYPNTNWSSYEALMRIPELRQNQN